MTVFAMHIIMYFEKKIKEIVSDSDFKTIHLPVLFGKKGNKQKL